MKVGECYKLGYSIGYSGNDYSITKLMKMSFGLDMDDVIMKATSGEIGYEIDNEINYVSLMLVA